MRTRARKKVNPAVDFVMAHRATRAATRRGDIKEAERWMRLAERQMTLWSATFEAEEQFQAAAARACPNCGYRARP
ncbi:MAG: hypothetical protein NW200_03810 [Hyphomonadaceae bacterium]|nr:hypothetical protein [Hyphomonadaceae bacterium]